MRSGASYRTRLREEIVGRFLEKRKAPELPRDIESQLVLARGETRERSKLAMGRAESGGGGTGGRKAKRRQLGQICGIKMIYADE